MIVFPVWKWEMINLDFVTGLARYRSKFDSIWVIAYWNTKSTQFFPVRTNNFIDDYVKLFLEEIVKFHGARISIMSDHGTQFLSHFCCSFERGLGTKVRLILLSNHSQMGIWKGLFRYLMIFFELA